MTMPINLVLVRHGESEGNIANQRSREGDHSAFTNEFKGRHSSEWRLTDRGIEQAKIAGQWIRENIREGAFHRRYSSEYVRAIETAGHLGLDGPDWRREFFLRERDWGQLDIMSQEERTARFAEEIERRSRDGFYWAPPGGESMANLCLRIERLFFTLHREASEMDVIVVCHGGTARAIMVRNERMTQERFSALESSRDPLDWIHNGQVIHYTRRDPVTGDISPYLDWVRSVCPWNAALSRNVWQPIVRKKFSNAELLEEAAKYPRIIND